MQGAGDAQSHAPHDHATRRKRKHVAHACERACIATARNAKHQTWGEREAHGEVEQHRERHGHGWPWLARTSVASLFAPASTSTRATAS